MEEKIKALLENEEFAAKLQACKTREAFMELVNSYGIDVEVLKKIVSADEAEDGAALSDEDLDAVSGGGMMDWLKKSYDTKQLMVFNKFLSD